MMRKLFVLVSFVATIIRAFGDHAFPTEAVLVARSDMSGSERLYARSGGSKQSAEGSGRDSSPRDRTGREPTQGQESAQARRLPRVRTQMPTQGREQPSAHALSNQQAQRQARRPLIPQESRQARAQLTSRLRLAAGTREHIHRQERAAAQGQAPGRVHALATSLQSHSNPRFRELGNEVAPMVAQVHAGYRHLMSQAARSQADARLASTMPATWVRHLEDIQFGRAPNRLNLPPEEISRRISEMRGHADHFAQHQRDMEDMHQEMSEAARLFEPGPGPDSGSGSGSGTGARPN